MNRAARTAKWATLLCGVGLVILACTQRAELGDTAFVAAGVGGLFTALGLMGLRNRL